MARSQSISNAIRLSFDEFDLDEANASLLRNGKPVAVAPTPFTLLCALARRPGTLLTKDALLDAVWGHEFVSDSVLKTAISDLRMVLGDDPRQPRFIETVSRRGYRFIAVPAAAPSAPPAGTSVPALAPRPSLSFIGRADAVSRLRQAWDGACSGQRAVVWIAGEPGIGKTTLIEHFVAGLGGIACARGQCVEHYGTGEPYLPVLEALAELCRSDRTLPALLRTVAPTWLLQLPWLSTAEERDALRRELAGVGPHRMLREMGEMLDRYTEHRPLLLVTEDLHWSDRATIQLIDYVARRRGSARLMWLASFRLAEVVALDHPLNPLRHELRLHDLCEEIVLDPFSETEVADYVAQRSQSRAGDEGFVRALHERTDGVPLFVASVMTDVMTRAAHAGGAAVGAGLADVAVPENLAAIIDHYIAKLGNEQRALLAAAAVCGAEFHVDTLSHALERDAAPVGQACEELAREQLWLTAPHAEEPSDAPERPYSFRHALFRQVLYERTPLSARVQLHGRVGAALERERAAGVAVAAAELAMHFERGRQPMTALRYYAEAAEAALAHLSPAECMALTERASPLLDQVPEGTERDELELALATLRGVSAFHVLGVGSEAKSAFERAYSLLRGLPQHPMRRRLAARVRIRPLSARGVCRGACGGGTSRGARVGDGRSPPRARGLHRAWRSAPASGPIACRPHMDRARARRRRAARHGTEKPSWPIRRSRCWACSASSSFALASSSRRVSGCSVRTRGRASSDSRRRTWSRSGTTPCWRCGWATPSVSRRLLTRCRRSSTSSLSGRRAARTDGSAVGRTPGWASRGRVLPAFARRTRRTGYSGCSPAAARSSAMPRRRWCSKAIGTRRKSSCRKHSRSPSKQGECVYLPQLLLIEAAIARARGAPAAAQASVRRAIAEARAQEAPWLELIAFVELCEHGGATAEDRQALAALVDRLPEAIDTAAVNRARALLA